MQVARLPITLFSDFVCPYSYITESALRKMLDGDHLLEYRAFELFPEGSGSLADWLSEEEWERIERLAAFEGVPLTRPAFLPRTTKAHEASRFARSRGVEEALRQAIFAGYWQEQRDIGRIDVLQGMAEEVGIDPEDLKIALDIDQFADEVVSEREIVRRLRIPGTPTIYLGTGSRARVIAGAHYSSQLRPFIEAAARDWLETEFDDV